MRSSAFDKGIRTGVIFGVVIVTMFLIGFTVAGAGLVGKLFGASSSYSTPSLVYFAIFMILMGMWAGISASPRPFAETDTLKRAITTGTFAGIIHGVFSAVIGFVFGTLIANKIDPRAYLPSVSPESIGMFLFNQTPMTGGLMLLALLTVSGSVGAALSFSLRSNDELKARARKATDSVWDTIRSERVASVVQNKYSRTIFLLIVAAILIILPRTWGGYWNYFFW